MRDDQSAESFAMGCVHGTARCSRPIGALSVLMMVTMLSLWGVSCAARAQDKPIDFDAITFSSSRTSSGTVKFIHGEHRERILPGSSSELIVKLTDWRAIGVVNGAQTAGVVIVTELGGSGTFYDFALLMKGPEGWTHVDTVFLGDRVKIRSVALQGNELLIEMVTHGPGEPMCCPTRQVRRAFAIDTGRLIPVGTNGGGGT